MPKVWDGRESILAMKDAGFRSLEANRMAGFLLQVFVSKTFWQHN